MITTIPIGTVAEAATGIAATQAMGQLIVRLTPTISAISSELNKGPGNVQGPIPATCASGSEGFETLGRAAFFSQTLLPLMKW